MMKKVESSREDFKGCKGGGGGVIKLCETKIEAMEPKKNGIGRMRKKAVQRRNRLEEE
jgi:hypothetical protein